MYYVLDSTGHVLRLFATRHEAEKFRSVRGRYDWSIESTDGERGIYATVYW